MRDRADEEAVAVSELLPGEEFAVIEYSNGWAWGFSVADHRIGYVEAIGLTGPVAPTHVVCEASAPIHPEPGVGSPILCRLPMGARLTGVERGPCLATEIGCVPLCYLRRIDEHEIDPVAVAERLLGAPYRGGGRSARGLDCSGLVQLAFGLCGVALPRESDQQRALGREVPAGEPLRRGDLLFSGEHVAIARGDAHVIHVSFSTKTVTVEPIEAARDGEEPLTARRLDTLPA